MQKLVIFDLDGTLVDTLPDISWAMNKALNNLGYNGSYSLEEMKTFIGSGEYILTKRAVEKQGIYEEEKIKEVQKMYNSIYTANCKNLTKPFEGIIDGLERLKENGFKLVVFSNKPHTETLKVVNYYFREGMFDYVRGGVEGFPIKPAIDGINVILNKLSIIDTTNTYYVGDSDVDMKTGINASLKTIGTSYGYCKRIVLESFNPYKVVDSVNELFELILNNN